MYSDNDDFNDLMTTILNHDNNYSKITQILKSPGYYMLDFCMFKKENSYIRDMCFGYHSLNSNKLQ
jgi:hypothetical protein